MFHILAEFPCYCVKKKYTRKKWDKIIFHRYLLRILSKDESGFKQNEIIERNELYFPHHMLNILQSDAFFIHLWHPRSHYMFLCFEVHNNSRSHKQIVLHRTLRMAGIKIKLGEANINMYLNIHTCYW